MLLIPTTNVEEAQLAVCSSLTIADDCSFLTVRVVRPDRFTRPSSLQRQNFPPPPGKSFPPQAALAACGWGRSARWMAMCSSSSDNTLLM